MIESVHLIVRCFLIMIGLLLSLISDFKQTILQESKTN